MTDVTQPVETQPVETQPVQTISQYRQPEPGNGNTIIYTDHLAKHFRNEYAVRDVSMAIPGGKIFGFIGPSGSGKTTTIRLLTGYYAPSAGKVIVFDRPPIRFNRRLRKMIGYMPQLFVLYPNLSVLENLNFAASIYGMGPLRARKLKQVLDFVDLYEHRNKLARNISGGMQRRLTLAATLVHDPTLLFLDEPTAGVDPVLRQRFWDHFRALRDSGRTLFVTTQYVSEANYCDLVGIMDEGVLVIVDTPHGLRYRAYGGDIVDVRTSETLDYRLEFDLYRLPFVRRVTPTGENSARLIVDEASTDVTKIVDFLRSQGMAVESVEEYQPPFDDVFVRLVKKEDRYV